MMAPRRSLLLCALSLAGLAAVACHELEARTAAGRIPPPTTEASDPAEFAGLHNVVAYAPGLLSGGVPVGTAGLDTLAAMGVKTVVSVDGATPLADYAESLGMRYVHLPISYDGVPEDRRRELAQVLASFDGPIYMHCHHGKHRSAAALGTAMVTAGKLTIEQAEARMKVSGTSPSYPGLWQSLRECKPLTPAELTADPASFPRIAEVTGLVATMSELDVVFDNVKAANEAAWSTPKDHPDLVAQNETGRLHRLFARLVDDPESQKLPADYQHKLQQAIADTEALDAAVRAGDREHATRLFATIKQSCKSCHVDYRDR